jgi:proteic killer suppression protein
MIRSFKDKKLEQCWKEGECKGIRVDLKRRLLMKLDSMDAATCIEDLRNPPSNHLHPLKGSYKGFWAISVNGPWRFIFRFENNDIFDVFFEQYH